MRPLLALAALSLGSFACAPPRTPIDFTVPSADENAPAAPFLETPWPSDLLVTKDGLDLSSFPNPGGSGALEDVIGLIRTNKAWAASGTLYFHVKGGVDETSLPADAAASLSQSSSMFLVELHPAFAIAGTDHVATDPSGVALHPVPIVWKDFAGGTSFLPPGTVAVQPLLGAVPRGPFALVVTSNARAKDGSALGPSPDLLALLRCEPLPVGRRPVDCAPYQAIPKALGVPPEDIALVQLITPEDATSGLVAAADAVRKLGAPELTGLTKRATSPSTRYDVYDGSAQIAVLQAGTAPYDTLDRAHYESGGIQFDGAGRAIIQRFEDVPFVVTVPHTAAPAAGRCVVIYGHGTGGDLESGIDDGSADVLADANCAMIGMSEPLHRTRAGFHDGETESEVETLTFNFFNPVAGRDNWRESAIEKVQLVSLAESLVIPASVTGGAEVRFDPAHIGYFGHSQGGITGALFVAVERRIAGAFLSGAGAGFQASLVEKTDPVNIPVVLKQILFLPDDETVDLFHPVIALLQTWIDPADPINYGPLWRERAGGVPSLVMTSGLKDTFTPPRCHGALAASYGLPLVKPVAADIPVLDVLGLPAVDPPAQGDLETVDGDSVTGGVLQYQDQGHFAVFDDPDAKAALRSFFTTFQTGLPAVQVQP